jgi:hypothetical protein
MKNSSRIDSLKTADLAGGLALSAKLALEISGNMAAAQSSIAKPGGTNYLDPAPIPPELIASILLVAISIANQGWSTEVI